MSTRPHARRHLLALLFASALATIAAAAQFDAPFALAVGEMADLPTGVRIKLIALTPEGKCPGGHSECVQVSPPQAQIELVASASGALQAVLPLLGPKSPEQRVGAWDVRVVAVAPYPFNGEDIERGRVSAAFVVTPAAK